MKCENCGNEHDGSYGSGRFCSELCKQQYNLKPKENRHYCCKFCGKEFGKPTSLAAHTSSCKLNPNASKTKRKAVQTRYKNTRKLNPLITITIKCCNCGNDFEQITTKTNYEQGKFHKCCSSYCSHSYATKFCDNEKRRQNIKIALAKGKAIGFCNSRKPPKKRFCEACGKEIVDDKFKTSKYCSIECKIKTRHEKLSRIAKQSGFAGYNEAFKKAKRGWYKGFWCGSSWELAFLIWALDHNLNIKRCNKIFKYTFDGKLRKYYPDFEIDGVIYEIKGYEDTLAKVKHQAFPDIVVLKYNELKDKIKYVKDTYGKDFVTMLKPKRG